MSTSVPTLQSLITLDPWTRAKDRFLDGLSDEERIQFDEASLRDLETFVYDASNRKKAYRAKSRMQPLIETLAQYKDAMDTFSDCNEMLKPIWGSILVVLTIVKAHNDYFDNLLKMFAGIADLLPNMREYEKLYREDHSLLHHLTNAYCVIIEFCAEVKKNFSTAFQAHGTSTSGPRATWSKLKFRAKVTSNSLSPMASSHYEELLSHLRNEAISVQDRASIVHQQQAQIVLQATKANERRRLLNKLSILDYARKHRVTFHSRHQDTNRWLFDPAQTSFSQFEEDKDSACICCYGTLGTGKTVLASSVIERFVGKGNLGTMTLFHYFDYLEPDSLSLSTFYGSLIRQILEVSTSHRLYSAAKQFLSTGIPSPVELEEFLLTKSLEEFKELFLVLDGLDELPKRDQQAVIRLIQALLMGGVAKVKIFLTCRTGQLADKKSLQACRKVEITANIVRNDLTRVINASVDQWIAEEDLDVDEPLRNEIVSRLDIEAEGMFLWVWLQLQELRDAAPSRAQFLRVLQDLPPTLAETYDRSLRNRLKDKALLELGTRVFTWVAFAVRPLTLEQVAEAVTIEAEDKHYEHDRSLLDNGRSLLTLCGSLIVHDTVTDIVSLPHSSVKDYLCALSNDERQLRISTEDAELYLCTTMLTYLCFTNFETAMTGQSKATTPLHSDQIDALTGGSNTRRTLAVSTVTALKRGTRIRPDTAVKLVARPARPAHDPPQNFKLLPYAMVAWPHFCRCLDLPVDTHPKISFESRPELKPVWGKLVHVIFDTEYSPWCQPENGTKDYKENRILTWAALNGAVPLMMALNFEAGPDKDLQQAIDTCSASSNPLMLAWRFGHSNVVKYLSNPNIVRLPITWRKHLLAELYRIARSWDDSLLTTVGSVATLDLKLRRSERFHDILELRDLYRLSALSNSHYDPTHDDVQVVLDAMIDVKNTDRVVPFLILLAVAECENFFPERTRISRASWYNVFLSVHDCSPRASELIRAYLRYNRPLIKIEVHNLIETILDDTTSSLEAAAFTRMLIAWRPSQDAVIQWLGNTESNVSTWWKLKAESSHEDYVNQMARDSFWQDIAAKDPIYDSDLSEAALGFVVCATKSACLPPSIRTVVGVTEIISTAAHFVSVVNSRDPGWQLESSKAGSKMSSRPIRSTKARGILLSNEMYSSIWQRAQAGETFSASCRKPSGQREADKDITTSLARWMCIATILEVLILLLPDSTADGARIERSGGFQWLPRSVDLTKYQIMWPDTYACRDMEDAMMAEYRFHRRRARSVESVYLADRSFPTSQ